MGHLFSDDVDCDLYSLIRTTSLDRVFSFVQARERVREIANDVAEDAAANAATEAPSSDTVPVSYVAPTSKPAKLVG